MCTNEAKGVFSPTIHPPIQAIKHVFDQPDPPPQEFFFCGILYNKKQYPSVQSEPHAGYTSHTIASKSG
jgi:hypothetical protein